jgi:heme-degrading monooxygenase HmoA
MTSAGAPERAIQLHIDLEVSPSREAELVETFNTVFRPAISRQPGFVEVQLLKFREARSGAPAELPPYRLVIAFETEQQRLDWVASDDHQRAWPAIKGTVSRSGAVLFESI